MMQKIITAPRKPNQNCMEKSLVLEICRIADPVRHSWCISMVPRNVRLIDGLWMKECSNEIRSMKATR